MEQDDIDQALEPLKPALVEVAYSLMELGAKAITGRIIAWLREIDSQSSDGKVDVGWLADALERDEHLEGLE